MISRSLIRISTVLAVAVLAGSAHTFNAPSAEAASFAATDQASLIAAIDGANATPGADTIIVGANITGVSLLLEVTEELTIEVEGFTIEGVRLRATASLTLNGPGTWTAAASNGAEVDISGAPGLGISEGNTLTISNLLLTARGTSCDAGIGGWNEWNAAGCADVFVIESGAVTIIDSTIFAKGGALAAGIGGGFLSGGSAVTLINSIVSSEPGSGVAGGIGGGVNHDTYPIDDPGATLSMSSSTLIGTTVRAHTTVNAGVTTLQEASRFDFPVSNLGTMQLDGTMHGSGIVFNQGIIRPASQVRRMDVRQNAFTIIANSALPAASPPTRFTVYAPSIADANEALRVPSRLGYSFAGWNTASDGLGVPVNNSSALATLADSSGQVTVFAQWVPAALVLAPSNSTMKAGDALAFTLTADGVGVTSSATFTSSNPGDTVRGNTVVPTAAGTRTITAELGGRTVQQSLTVDAAALDVLSMTPSAATVNQGDTITLTLEGRDLYGNPVIIDPATVTVTSSVPSDVINGLTVRFPTASPHTITVTVGAQTASTTIQVSPAALLPAASGSLVRTGSGSMVAPLAVAIVLIIAGAATLIMIRRRNSHETS